RGPAWDDCNEPGDRWREIRPGKPFFLAKIRATRGNRFWNFREGDGRPGGADDEHILPDLRDRRRDPPGPAIRPGTAGPGCRPRRRRGGPAPAAPRRRGPRGRYGRRPPRRWHVRAGEAADVPGRRG